MGTSHNLSLVNNSFLQIESLCQRSLTHQFEECFSFGMQTIRTLKQLYIETFTRENTRLKNDKFSMILSFSYAFESCPNNYSQHPISVCLFGKFYHHLIISILLSCPLYQIKVYNNDDPINGRILSQFRVLFPNRSIQWIPGSFSSSSSSISSVSSF